MDEKTAQLIEAIASKLGTTAEHLWGVMIRQAAIDSVVHASVFAVAVAWFSWWVRFVLRKTTPTEDYRYGEWHGEGAVLVWTVTVVVGALLLATFFIGVAGVVAGFTNPEYWALKQILK